jgi:hypothetical protein
MTLMTERSCAVVTVDDAIYLCLPESTDVPIFAPAGISARTLRQPEEYDHTIRVFAGSAHDDFRWTHMVASHTPGTLACAGVAAAVTALIFGIALRSKWLLGSELSTDSLRTYYPPRESWWSGEWRVEVDETRTCHRAALRIHGVLVLG